MKLKMLTLGLLLAAVPAFGADIDGKWTGSVDSPNGAVQVGFTFKAEESTLTGTSIGPDGSSTPIKDGKIAGNKISFSLTVDFGFGPTTFNYTGDVAPAQIKLHTSFMDTPIDIALKKA